MKMISPTLNVPQARFLSMPHKFKAYVAGFGSGKTWIGCGGICKGIWEHPGINQGYFAPTYPQIRDIFYPTVEEVAADWGLNVKINEGNKEVHFYYGRQYRGTTICRSMEKPQTIVGFKIGNALVETTSKGDRNPSEVRLLVQIQRNGGWVTEKDITIKGKTTSQYLASVVVDNLPPRPFSIRMRRMTPDSTTDQLQNKTLWSSYTEIIDVKQCYPNTALFGVQVDSEQFGSQQVSRNYHLRGRILQVPSNYNPQTRQYSGIWDGTFKPAYSNNMAWCMWDMLTHPRYGMGKRLGAADVDKWALYVIGQYCDQSVPDGFGGTEPRITCNAYLTTQRKAWDVLSDFCSAMRCMPVWNGQTLTFVQDRPSDKVWTYNRSNVVMPDDGAPFRYSFSALKDRHNAVEVNWIDPNNGWETATELVEDTQAIARYGRNVTKMDAFGCTSRGQAHRAGLWLIKTELLETQTVDFSVGAEGLRHVPGDVIEICDDD
ncbi:TPA: terminase family protein [Escherichia coli]|nr:terminase family protein [Escherichia coli]